MIEIEKGINAMANKTSQVNIDFHQKLGERIRLYRRYKKMTQGEFSVLLGLTTNQVNLYEKGKGDLKISKLKQISEILEIPLIELIPDDGSYEQLSPELIELITIIKMQNLNLKSVLNLINAGKRSLKNEQ